MVRGLHFLIYLHICVNIVNLYYVSNIHSKYLSIDFSVNSEIKTFLKIFKISLSYLYYFVKSNLKFYAFMF